KERGCGRGKTDGCQNKADSKTGPNWDAKERVEGESRYEWGRTVRMGLDYTRQCSIASFTKSRIILKVFKLMKDKDLAMRYRADVGQCGAKRSACPRSSLRWRLKPIVGRD